MFLKFSPAVHDNTNDIFGMEISYDQKNAIFGSRAPGATPWSGLSGFDEKNITYDQNGNIMTLKRNAVLSNAMTEVDNLSYTYTGNRLDNVTDGTGGSYAAAGFRNLTGSGSPYLYNVNGDLTSDPKKGLSIDYNAIGKTDKITITTSVGPYINYTYDAGGTLLKKQIFDNNVAGKSTDYIDGFVYENGTLAYFAMPEGRIRNTGTALKAEYMIRDHQGNVRVSFEEQVGVAVVRQENSYYPLGLIMPGSNIATPTSANNNLYNEGSEWQNDFGDLPDYYNTFFRNYDAALGRFIGIDPKAEASESFSTYQYANNNPLLFNDPLGDIAISQETLNLLDKVWKDGGEFGGVFTLDGNSGRAIFGTMTYFNSDQDSMGEMDEYLSKNGYWGFTTAKNFDKAWANFSTGKATESSGAELVLRRVDISETKENKYWLAERQKEALADAKLDGSVFYGVPVYAVDALFKGNDALTAPGYGIFLNSKNLTNLDLLRHEYGHILQAKKFGMKFYYTTIAPGSLASGHFTKKFDNYEHKETWTEWSANDLSYSYFGKPTDWKMGPYPIMPPLNYRPGIYPFMSPVEFYGKY